MECDVLFSIRPFTAIFTSLRSSAEETRNFIAQGFQTRKNKDTTYGFVLQAVSMTGNVQAETDVTMEDASHGNEETRTVIGC